MENKFLALIRAVRTNELIEKIEAERERGKKLFSRPDWIWVSLLEAAATLGRTPRNMRCLLSVLGKRFGWAQVADLTDADLSTSLEQVYLQHGVRFRNRKIAWAKSNRKYLKNYGDPQKFKERWINEDLNAAINLLVEFSGVSAKYARNIGMVACDARFMNCAALDTRILRLLRTINPRLPTTGDWYHHTEAYMQELASRLEMTTWDLDRTMYQCYSELLRGIEFDSSGTSVRSPVYGPNCAALWSRPDPNPSAI